MIEKFFEDQQVIPNNKFISASTVLTPKDQVVVASITGNITVTLPPVASARGKFYSIILRARSAGTLTVADSGDSEGWTNTTDQDAVGDCRLWYSDGLKWWDMASKIA